MEIIPHANGFGAVVTGVPFEGGGLETAVCELERALDDHLLLVFREVCLSQEDYIRFGGCFGRLETFPAFGGSDGGHSLGLSNLARDGSILPEGDPIRRSIAADAMWHTDNTYRVNRARYSALMAGAVPVSGGETEYCDTRAAYDALPDDMKRNLDGLVGLHSILYSRGLAGYNDWTEQDRAGFPPMPQPLVLENPRTGRKSLYIAVHIGEIVGMPTDEARRLVFDLIDFASQPRFVYSHKWRRGDIVMWDDRATMHRRAPYDDMNEARKLYTMRVIEPSDLYDPQATYVIT